jgi:hypothetical protein
MRELGRQRYPKAKIRKGAQVKKQHSRTYPE